MKIKLYNNISDKKVVNKNIIYVNELEGNIKENTDIINPVILLNINSIDFNYIYIEAFNRYYYVNNIKLIRNNLFEIDCHVDVLMSFKDEFKNNDAIISMSQMQSNYEKNFDGNNYISKLETFIEVSEFESGFLDEPEFILLTAGPISE